MTPRDESLNKRAKLLAGTDGKEWTERLEKLEYFNQKCSEKAFKEQEVIYAYFNCKQRSGGYLKTGYDKLDSEKEYFRCSIELFNAVFQKQKAKTDKDTFNLPKLELKDRYDALITVVGFSPQPLMHTILTLKPEQVYLVATRKSATFDKICIGDFFQFLIDKFDLDIKIAERKVHIFEPDLISDRADFDDTASNIKIKELKIVEAIGSFDTFKKVRKLIKKIRDKKPEATIAIDITGGKKSMDASAFLTAAIEDKIDIFYVDFEGYSEGKPVYGTEFLNKLDNPYDIYNVRDKELIKEFWERKDYEQVAIITKKVIDRMDDKKVNSYELQDERKQFEQIQTAAQCYAAWSNFNYEEACQHSFDFFYYNEKQDCVLSILADCSEQRKTAQGAIYLATDRWMRGCDFLYKNLDKFENEPDKFGKDLDKAALCFTQVIECLSEFRLWDMKDKLDIKPVDYEDKLDKMSFNITSLLGFIFDYSKKEINCSKQKKDEDYKLRAYIRKEKDKPFVTWKPLLSNKFRLPRNEIQNFKELREAVYVRNDLSHFNCFTERNCTEYEGQKKEVENLKNVSEKYIKLFIDTYKDDLEIKNFDDIKKPFEFTTYDKFQN